MTVAEYKEWLLATVKYIEYREKENPKISDIPVYRFDGNECKEYKGTYLEEQSEDGKDYAVIWNN